MIKLYHYSNIDFKGYIKPSFYGLNYYTSNDKKITNVKRSFFYDKPEPELLLKNNKFLYITEISQDKIYNLTEDKRGFLKESQGDIDQALREIKKEYRGVIYKIGYNIINLFYPIKIKDQQTLTR